LEAAGSSESAGLREKEDIQMDRVVHFEIPFDDKQRAMKFYSDSFGWRLMDLPQTDYVIASSVDVDETYVPTERGAINGGLYQRPKDVPHPTIFVRVESVAAAIERAEAAGGRLVTPRTPIPGLGAFARVADTEGNVIGLFEGQS
jgi:predicted enzyme related to lactoylglutathione lyase